LRKYRLTLYSVGSTFFFKTVLPRFEQLSFPEGFIFFSLPLSEIKTENKTKKLKKKNVTGTAYDRETLICLKSNRFPFCFLLILFDIHLSDHKNFGPLVSVF